MIGAVGNYQLKEAENTNYPIIEARNDKEKCPPIVEPKK